jgi:hypothetical protein
MKIGKRSIFIIGDSIEFNNKVQKFLFENGYKWHELDIDNNYKNSAISISKSGDPGCLTTNANFQMGYDNFSYYNDHKDNVYKNYKWFNKDDDWNKVLEYFEVEIENPNIYFRGQGYKI